MNCPKCKKPFVENNLSENFYFHDNEDCCIIIGLERNGFSHFDYMKIVINDNFDVLTIYRDGKIFNSYDVQIFDYNKRIHFMTEAYYLINKYIKNLEFS